MQYKSTNFFYFMFPWWILWIKWILNHQKLFDYCRLSFFFNTEYNGSYYVLPSNVFAQTTAMSMGNTHEFEMAAKVEKVIDHPWFLTFFFLWINMAIIRCQSSCHFFLFRCTTWHMTRQRKCLWRIVLYFKLLWSNYLSLKIWRERYRWVAP